MTADKVAVGVLNSYGREYGLDFRLDRLEEHDTAYESEAAKELEFSGPANRKAARTRFP